ncbi:unnamed protein product [Prorocentrum cordatum]|uniref:Uncharacterized protein n=1 Tax=Prorocentrum cordatum TaxID=2364126 RepID=A0ABN9Y7T8_9DINO|nr:unnamed protein product [Polarella glacialis]
MGALERAWPPRGAAVGHCSGGGRRDGAEGFRPSASQPPSRMMDAFGQGGVATTVPMAWDAHSPGGCGAAEAAIAFSKVEPLRTLKAVGGEKGDLAAQARGVDGLAATTAPIDEERDLAEQVLGDDVDVDGVAVVQAQIDEERDLAAQAPSVDGAAVARAPIDEKCDLAGQVLDVGGVAAAEAQIDGEGGMAEQVLDVVAAQIDEEYDMVE